MAGHEGGRDGGMITAFTATLSMGLIFVAGMVYDGGQRVNTYMRAADLASSAARAGAQQAVPETLYDDAAGTRLDHDRAVAAARAFLTEAESPAVAASAQVDVVGPDEDQVHVEVMLDQTAVILTWLGTVEISAEATATATPGVEASTGGP
ncbi:MAG: hypothetical protein ACRD2C_07670 [Acidimicrobiales bacterium]